MGKLTTLLPDVWRERHGEKLNKFVALARAHDPLGKFSNDYTDHWIFNAGTGGQKAGVAEAAQVAR